MANGKIETYPEAARVIHLWLEEFCDETRVYPDMIAEAARRAAKEIERLRNPLKSKQLPPPTIFGKVKFIGKALFVNPWG